MKSAHDPGVHLAIKAGLPPWMGFYAVKVFWHILVMPAQAGIHAPVGRVGTIERFEEVPEPFRWLDARLRGHDAKS